MRFKCSLSADYNDKICKQLLNMEILNQSFLLEQIEQIIIRSRSGDELFFTDYKKAAINILQLLENQKALATSKSAVQIKINEHSKAA